MHKLAGGHATPTALQPYRGRLDSGTLRWYSIQPTNQALDLGEVGCARRCDAGWSARIECVLVSLIGPVV